MIEDDLDRALNGAVNVDPSPEFLARIRMRVAAEPVPRRWGWRMVAAAIAVPAVLVVIVALLPTAPSTSSSQAAQATLPTVPVASASVVAAASPASVPASVPPSVPMSAERRSVTHERRVVPVHHSPEVLISPDDARGLELLAVTARSGKLSDVKTVAESRAAAQIDIPPMVIEPLPQIARLE